MSAFLAIYERYKRDVLTLSAALLGRRDGAEDVLHDVFVSLAEGLRHRQPPKNLKGYLLTAAANRVRDTFRKAKREPEDDPVALRSERWRLTMFATKREFEAALALGKRLFPLLQEEYRRWKHSGTSPIYFNDYLIALAATGRIAEAQDAFRQIAAMEAEIPESLNPRAKQKIREDNRAKFDRNLDFLALAFYQRANTSVDDINRILGVDVMKDDRFKRFRSMFPAHPEPTSRR